MEIGKRIAELRKKRNLTQAQLADRFVSKMKALVARRDVCILAITRWFNQKYFAYFLSRATPDELFSLGERIASGTLRILFVGLPSLWNSEKERKHAGLLELKGYYE
jgi:transcriptional regulator with XRE-family HTH domain